MLYCIEDLLLIKLHIKLRIKLMIYCNYFCQTVEYSSRVTRQSSDNSNLYIQRYQTNKLQRCIKYQGVKVWNSISQKLGVEASHAKVTQAAAFKHNPLLPFSHTFGINTTFCYCIAATYVIQRLARSPSDHCTHVRFALGLRTRGMEVYGIGG